QCRPRHAEHVERRADAERDASGREHVDARPEPAVEARDRGVDAVLAEWTCDREQARESSTEIEPGLDPAEWAAPAHFWTHPEQRPHAEKADAAAGPEREEQEASAEAGVDDRSSGRRVEQPGREGLAATEGPEPEVLDAAPNLEPEPRQPTTRVAALGLVEALIDRRVRLPRGTGRLRAGSAHWGCEPTCAHARERIGGRLRRARARIGRRLRLPRSWKLTWRCATWKLPGWG